MTGSVRLTPWPLSEAPTEAHIRRMLADDGLDPYSWSNAAHDVYAAHNHSYDKVIFVVTGSITFGLPDENRKITLIPGDRLDLPAGLVHDAVVGEEGVVCLEAHGG